MDSPLLRRSYWCQYTYLHGIVAGEDCFVRSFNRGCDRNVYRLGPGSEGIAVRKNDGSIRFPPIQCMTSSRCRACQHKTIPKAIRKKGGEGKKRKGGGGLFINKIKDVVLFVHKTEEKQKTMEEYQGATWTSMATHVPGGQDNCRRV